MHFWVGPRVPATGLGDRVCFSPAFRFCLTLEKMLGPSELSPPGYKGGFVKFTSPGC